LVNRAHAVFQAAELRNCEALDADDALGIFPDLKTAAGAVSAKTALSKEMAKNLQSFRCG
jgi:hypothetical protein